MRSPRSLLHRSRALLPWLLLLAGPLACGPDDSGSAPSPAGPTPGEPQLTLSCVQCHTSEDMLVATAEPVEEDPHGETGEG